MQQNLSEGMPLHGATILIVDDELFIGLDLEESLREAGASVIGPCMSLRTAMKAAENESFDVAILDIRLGRETSESVADLLASRDIPFLFYSGHKFKEGTRGQALGALLIAKPAPDAALIGAVAELLASHASGVVKTKLHQK